LWNFGAYVAALADEQSLRESLRKRAGQLFIGIVDLLKSECSGAVKVLVVIANDGKSPAASRVSAASRIVELTLKTGEMQTLEKRVAELEELAKGRL
jgi:hypothetical protein